MKKLILILLTITLLSSCNLWTDKTDGTLIVAGVELCNGGDYKYKVTFTSSLADCYTNIKYSIGDTLQLKSLHH